MGKSQRGRVMGQHKRRDIEKNVKRVGEKMDEKGKGGRKRPQRRREVEDGKISKEVGREREEGRRSRETSCERKENKRSGRSGKRETSGNTEMSLTVKSHSLLVRHAKLNYSRTDPHVPLPPVEKTFYRCLFYSTVRCVRLRAPGG